MSLTLVLVILFFAVAIVSGVRRSRRMRRQFASRGYWEHI